MTLLSILSPIEDVLTASLEWLHSTVGLSWAWAVIALTIVVRMLLVPLTVRQIHSMQRMQQYLPEMKAIQKRYKTDRRKQNEELMKFYREHQINPASSCLPVIPQIPIFFALYFVLRDFDKEIYPQYRDSHLGWLEFVPNITADITAHWSGYVLLAVYVASQVASTWFMPTQNTAQRVIFLVLPFVFALFIINPEVFGASDFPVGLLLYWMTTNLWTVGQGLVTRGLRQTQSPPPKRSSRTPPKEQRPDRGEARTESAAPATASGQPRRVKRKKKRSRR
ncbi:MAG: YidC/Oxa1 family membrane protein insertase [Actinomycetota bacterium]|nr:YidC/Oxa1 family membrane protein insertase [Actinomycetota bacterium]